MQRRAIWSRTPVFSNRLKTVAAYSPAGYPGISTRVGIASVSSSRSRYRRTTGIDIASST
jgi:hypothetical protein